MILDYLYDVLEEAINEALSNVGSGGVENKAEHIWNIEDHKTVDNLFYGFRLTITIEKQDDYGCEGLITSLSFLIGLYGEELDKVQVLYEEKIKADKFGSFKETIHEDYSGMCDYSLDVDDIFDEYKTQILTYDKKIQQIFLSIDNTTLTQSFKLVEETIKELDKVEKTIAQLNQKKTELKAKITKSRREFLDRR